MEIIEASCSEAPSNHDSPQHSHWLQETLSDVNKRMQAMMALLREDCYSSDRVESCYKKRQELIQMLEEFGRSYRYLAEKYDRLRSTFHHVNNSVSTPYSATNNNKDRHIEFSDNSNSEVSDPHPEYVVEGHEMECGNTDFDIEYLSKLADEMMLTGECKLKLKAKLENGENHMDKKATTFCQTGHISMKMNNGLLQATAKDFSEDSYKWENTWCELKFQITTLMEDNLQQQAELARRNIEKRLLIDKLQLQLQHMKAENRALQSCISCLKVGEKRNQIRGSFLGKFFGGSCS